MSRLLVFGPGYTASRIAAAVEARGWEAVRVGREGVTATLPPFTHALSSVPPGDEGDPILAGHGEALRRSGAWIGYLSSTSLYGDTGGGWVDESAATGIRRRSARAEADRAWLDLGARVFRLPGIYGPGRSPLDRVADGTARRVDRPGHVFSRVHVDDIVAAVLAGLDAPAGAYNIADDQPAPQEDVVIYAAGLLGMAAPPIVPLESLSPPARAFYAESRRVANGKAKRVLGWSPLYPGYREGLRALSATTSPTKVSAAPSAAVTDQR